MNGDKSMSLAIGMLFVENVAGLIAGIIMGLIGWLFKFITGWKGTIYLKMCYCIGCAIGFVLVGEATHFANSKYIASLTFGYVSYWMWGEDKPSKELGWFWWFI
jgi:hypothetical protein